MRTVLVTGGAVRIGRAIVERLAAEGYAVAIHCHRSTEEAHALSRGLRAKGARVEVVVADLGDPATLGGLVRDARAALGPLALLVNNASAFEPDDIHSLDAALWERHFRINLGAPVFLARDFAAQVPEGAGGAVVNVIDQRVWKPTPQFFSYTLEHNATPFIYETAALMRPARTASAVLSQATVRWPTAITICCCVR